MSCIQEGTTCGNGNGLCGNGTCNCLVGFVSYGDVMKDATCQVNSNVSQGLWAFSLVLWVLEVMTCFVAIWRLERRNKEAIIHEIFVICWFLMTGIFGLIVSGLELSSEYPGQNSVGLNVSVTTMYVVMSAFVWLFLVFNPFSKAQTGVSALAVARIKKMRFVFLVLTPIIFFMSLLGSLLLYGVLYSDPDIGKTFTQSFFALTGISMFIFSVMNGLVLYLLHVDFSKALTSTKEIPSSHRQTVEKLIKSTRTMIAVPIFTGLIYSPVFLAFSSPALSSQAWIMIPVQPILGGLWILRYLLRSIKSSERLAREKLKSSVQQRQTHDLETKSSEKKLTDSNSSSISSGGKSKGKRKKFRLKGLRPKPLQFMSHVTEGNSEGTVRFTHVEGVGDMHSSRHSQQQGGSHYSNAPNSPLISSMTGRTTSDLSHPDTTPRETKDGHVSIKSVQMTLWEVDINGQNQTN